MSVEHGFLSAGSEPGTESTRNRIGMEKYQGLDPPLMGIRDFQVRAWVEGGAVLRAHPVSLGTRRDSSSCREPSLLEVIFQQPAQETAVT